MRGKILLALPALALIGLGTHQVVVKPFGYVDMRYAASATDFNAHPDVIASRYGLQRERVDSAWAAELAALPLRERITRAHALVRAIQKDSVTDGRPRKRSELFATGPEYLTICSEDAKIFVALMQSAGTPARVLWMCGHTTSEVYDGQQWIVVDTHQGLMFKRAGKYLALTDTLGLDDVELEPIGAPPSFETRAVYAKADTCVVQIHPVFEFQDRLEDPAAVAGGIALGASSVARGLQYVEADRAWLGSPGAVLRAMMQSGPPR